MKPRLNWLVTSITIFMLASCTQPSDHKLEPIMAAYYETYNKRENIDDLIAFYADSLVLEDMITGDVKRGKEELRTFFDWPNPNFKLTTDNTLMVTETIIGNDNAAISGYFEPFEWGEYRFEAMHFTMVFRFDEAGKIIHHKDWINYPNNLLDYANRKNSNDRLSSNNPSDLEDQLD